VTHDNERILDYWNRDDVESMYDKHLLGAEIELIKKRIPPGAKVLDAGCGEAEGTVVYSSIPNVVIDAVDFSSTRLNKAAERLQGRPNVFLKTVNFLGKYQLDQDYDIIVSQRFLINLLDPELQHKVLFDLMALLKSGGRLLMLEGSRQGVDSLNEFRAAAGLAPIPIRWHNLFFDDQNLVKLMERQGYHLVEQDGLGTYFVLTRGIRPKFDTELNWDCEFNRLAASEKMKELLGFGTQFSRLKLWCFQK
jgi:ubiquinone/menaquinone biosynthesis C-methylase UbiE